MQNVGNTRKGLLVAALLLAGATAMPDTASAWWGPWNGPWSGPGWGGYPYYGGPWGGYGNPYYGYPYGNPYYGAPYGWGGYPAWGGGYPGWGGGYPGWGNMAAQRITQPQIDALKAQLGVTQAQESAWNELAKAVLAVPTNQPLTENAKVKESYDKLLAQLDPRQKQMAESFRSSLIW